MKISSVINDLFCKQFNNLEKMKDNSKINIKMDAIEFYLHISNERKIVELQREFNSYFPYLKIEFFKVAHKIGEGTPKMTVFSEGRLIADCRILKNEGDIFIHDGLLVSNFEIEFFEKYGLSVQVFRKVGKVWLETSATDNWSLKAQNKEGRELAL